MTIAIKAPARYVQGAGELKQLGRNLKQLGSCFYILASENGRRRFEATVTESLHQAEKKLLFGAFAGEATKEEVARHGKACQAAGCDAIIGMGGGKVIDTAKAVAEALSIPCIIVPTVASNDAPCSGVAVLYNDEGVVVKALIMKRNPDLVLVDTQIIAETPPRLFVAGLGDAMATWFEARACQRSGAKTMARGQATQAAMAMARLCHDTLMAHGQQALAAVSRREVTQALELVVEASILLSGIGFESGGLAAAHAINDGLAHAPQAHGALHGEKVAFGVLAQLLLEEAPGEELTEILTFMSQVGLPVTFRQLGLNTPDRDTLMKVAEMASIPTQSMKNLSPDLTPEQVYKAIIKADELGASFAAL